MGLILKTFVPINVATKRKTLIQNRQASSFGVEKFSLVHSSNVAAAKSPTTAGRSPAKTLCTVGCFMYLMKSFEMRIIRMSDGSTSAKVDTQEPRTAAVS